MPLSALHTSIQTISGIGEKTAVALARLNIHTVGDLLWHFPTHLDRKQHLTHLQYAEDGQGIIAKLRITEIEHPKQYHPRTKIVLRFTGTLPGGEIYLEFLHRPPAYILQSVKLQSEWWVRGTLQFFNGYWSMIHPQFSRTAPPQLKDALLEPIYPLTYAITNTQLSQYIRYALDHAPTLPEWLPEPIVKRYALPTWRDAICQAHQPPALQTAIPKEHVSYRRLSYDEAFIQQLSLQLVRRHQNKVSGRSHKAAGTLVQRYIAGLPFPLTNAQQRVIREIDADQQSPLRMMRLLQGDVGSGKTVVATAAMLWAIESGAQAALMVPTDLLARQHYQTITRQLSTSLPDIKVGLLVSKMSKSEKQELLAGMASGMIQIIIGTHALFQPEVTFLDLGLIVIDEQHRFGVEQRLALAAKAHHPVDTLVMTATPIPRSLTLAIFGDMDCSRLDEKPAERIPITTRIVNKERLDTLVDSLHHLIEKKEQVYWVCPLIDSTTEDDTAPSLTTVEERFTYLKEHLACKVVWVHGKQKLAEREAAMQSFTSGEALVLVATTVIEVGIDVPAATTIIIEHAERFGLAQLHQLRGRVGRGSDASHCILLYSQPLSAIAKERLTALRNHTDGFFLAEEDLRLRGSGDVLGTKQSGMPNYRVFDPLLYPEMLTEAASEAASLLQADPQLTSPQGRHCRLALELYGYQDAMRYVHSG